MLGEEYPRHARAPLPPAPTHTSSGPRAGDGVCSQSRSSHGSHSSAAGFVQGTTACVCRYGGAVVPPPTTVMLAEKAWPIARLSVCQLRVGLLFLTRTGGPGSTTVGPSLECCMNYALFYQRQNPAPHRETLF